MDVDKITDSVISRGDLSGLSPEQKIAYYRAQCERLGLDPLARPFDLLRLSGKEVLYLTKGGSDQLAMRHKLSRRVVRGPVVEDWSGTKVLVCVVECSTPDGRVEQDMGTVPLKDPVNDPLKCLSKARRRCTLALLGAGMLAEDEVDDVPAHAKSPVPPIDPRPAAAAPPTVEVVPVDDGACDDLIGRLAMALTAAEIDALNYQADGALPRGSDARRRYIGAAKSRRLALAAARAREPGDESEAAT